MGIGHSIGLHLREESFNPLSLRGLSLWLDASRIQGLSNGDVCSLWEDLSGNGRHATAAGAARPVYNTDVAKGRAGVKFDGAAQYMATSAIDFTGTQAVSLFAVFSPLSTAASRVILDAGMFSNPSFVMYHSQEAEPATLRTVATEVGDSGIYYRYNASKTLGAPIQVSAVLDKSTNPDTTDTYLHGVQNLNPGNGGNNTNKFGNTAITIGRRGSSATMYYKGYLFEILIYNRALTVSERNRVEAYLMDKWFFRMLESQSIHDSLYSISQTNYTYRGAFSRVIFQTEATEFSLDFYTNIYATYPSYASLGVVVNGVYTTTLSASVDSFQQTASVSGLASGLKTIEIINGLQSGSTGTWVTRIWSPKSIIPVAAVEPNNRLVIYGDSIAVGDHCTTPTSEAWAVLVRAAYSGGVSLDAYGGRSLYTDAQTTAKRSAFVYQMSSVYPGMSVLWLAIGTNDYGLQRWSSSDFGAAYAAVLDDLHASLPTATIYCQSPIVRSSEVELHAGWGTLGAYRTQISNAVASRTPWAVFVDGTALAFPQAGDLFDGLKCCLSSIVRS